MAAPSGGPGLPPARSPPPCREKGCWWPRATGHFLITQAQWEGEPEFLGPVLATWDHLVGDKFS